MGSIVDYMITKNRRLDGIGMQEGEKLILKMLKARHLVWQATRGRRGPRLSSPAAGAIEKGDHRRRQPDRPQPESDSQGAFHRGSSFWRGGKCGRHGEVQEARPQRPDRR